MSHYSIFSGIRDAILSRSYWIILFIIFSLGLYLRLSLPQLPICDADTGEYLSPAVGMVYTGHYTPTYRDFLYPYFLTAVLTSTESLYAIVLIQHFSGVVAAALVVTIIFRLRIFFPSSSAFDWSTRAVALLAASGLLFSQFTILMEHSIRPEGLFPMTCAVTMLAGVELSRRVLLKKYDGRAILWSVVLVVFSFGNVYLKPAWGLAAATSLLPLVYAWVFIPGRWLRKVGAGLGALFLVVCAFILPSTFHKNRLAAMSAWFLPGTLLSAHAEVLYNVIEKDVLRLPVESKERTYLTAFLEEIRNAQKNPTTRRYGLKIDPDNLLWGGPIDRLFDQFERPEEFSKMCYSYYFRGWVEYPLAMLSKVIKQMEFFYSPKENNVYSSRHGDSLKFVYNEDLQDLRRVQSNIPWPPLEDYFESLQKLDLPEQTSILRAVLASTVVWLNYLFLPMALLSVAGAAVVLLSGNKFASLYGTAILVLYLASFNFFTSLTISLVHMMDVARYYFGQITMSLVSQGFQFLFLFALIRNFVLEWKEKKARDIIGAGWSAPRVTSIEKLPPAES